MIQQLDLGGTWKARWSDGERGRRHAMVQETCDDVYYIPAQVPGEIHLDAWAAGLIGDVRLGTEALAARWVEECHWTYRREFVVPEDAVNAPHAWLHFAGLDYRAVILLNGMEIGRHENFFYPCLLAISGRLRPGRNFLIVHLDSGLHAVCDKPAEGYVPQWMGDRERLTKRHWLRKPQSQFDWDWSTRLINVGIPKPVTLEWCQDPVRMDQLVALATVEETLQEGTLGIRWFAEGVADRELPAVLTVELPAAGRRICQDVTIRPGFNPLNAEIKVPQPRLWWPVGHGEANLYAVEVSLEIGGTEVARARTRVGFRRVVVNQDPHPVEGRYFIFEINGKKIFAKGGNFVPADLIFARLDRVRYATLIDRALEANFNFLRIWGGGLYEADEFYDLCDERGILVWQEFIFACSKYPAQDEAFHESVKREATYQIRRLTPHPSLIAWCGNNEMEWGAWHWGYDQGIVNPDHALFHITLPRLLAREDGTRYYQPSSPYSPEERDPTDEISGDQHPWAVGMQNGDFRDYRKMKCRFPNEGGILGPNALPTLLACLPEGQRFPLSFAWQVHDNSVSTWEEPSLPDEMVRKWLGIRLRNLSLEEYTYWAGLVHGEGLREYCENFRRRMFDSSSAIFWMYNDCWPTVRSWTIVDYYLRRTPAFHPVRRAMAPVHVVLAEESGQVTVFGINEHSHAVRASLRHGLFTLAGRYLKDETKEVELPANASTRIASFPSEEWTGREASMPFALLSVDGNMVARGRTFSPLFQEIHWPEAPVRVELREGEAVFHCPTFAWNVCIDLDGEERISDNFFDVFPGIPHAIPWKGDVPPKILHLGNCLASVQAKAAEKNN